MGVVRANPAPGRVRVAVFDFDGTVSLLRMGWQDVMAQLMTEVVPLYPGERAKDLLAEARAMVHRTNGQPTIVQMQIIADEVRARGAPARSAEDYKSEFLKRLHRQLEPRLTALGARSALPSRWRMPGVIPLLEQLRARHIICYIASGTDEHAVQSESTLLELSPYFTGIYGARDDVANSTKPAIIRRLVAEHALQQYEFVVLGDGAEEIRVGKESGALAVAIARDDHTGAPDPEQQTRLTGAGADVYVADFLGADEIMHYLFG